MESRELTNYALELRKMCSCYSKRAAIWHFIFPVHTHNICIVFVSVHFFGFYKKKLHNHFAIIVHTGQHAL